MSKKSKKLTKIADPPTYDDLIDVLLQIPDGETVVLYCPECHKIEAQDAPYALPYCLCLTVYAEDRPGLIPASPDMSNFEVTLMMQVNDDAALAVYTLGGVPALRALLSGDDE